jgi:hypothetical protein
MAIFNRSDAIKYAYKFAYGYNPDFPVFSYRGGDCTNFVSQAMFAGGWPFIYGPRFGDNRVWWASPYPGSSDDIGLVNSKLSHSRTWTAAQNFCDHIYETRKCESCLRDHLDHGDIVQIQAMGGDCHHTMLVTKKLSGIDDDPIYVSYHDRHTLNRLLSDIEAMPDYANDRFLYWKVKDIIPNIPGVIPRVRGQSV